jgi:hypothetical protein
MRFRHYTLQQLVRVLEVSAFFFAPRDFFDEFPRRESAQQHSVLEQIMVVVPEPIWSCCAALSIEW